MQFKFHVEDASQVAEARRGCAAIAERAGFSEADAGRVALAATEFATNLLKHASGGFLVAGLIESPSETATAIQLMSFDKGPGIPDLAAATKDGFSTAGSPGTGLGALHRLSNRFEVSTSPESGTAMLAILYPSRAKVSDHRRGWGAVSIPISGEDVCGDAWAAAPTTIA